jgi:hypothetical protein
MIDTQMECSSMSKDWRRLSLANTPFDDLSIPSTRDVFPGEDSDRSLPMRYHSDAPFLDACDVQVSNCRFAVIERVFNTGAPALAAARRPKEIDMIFDQRSWTSSTQRLARSAGESMRNADKYGHVENAR